MSDPDVFDFEEVAMHVPSPGERSTPSSRLPEPVDQPRGTLFGSSPAYVASEVTGGRVGK